MPLVTFIDHAGAARQVNAPDDISLMEAARQNDIPGIDADCGGVCACATCHVYVAEPHLGRLPAPDDTEDAMLDFVEDRREGSRLACQIRLSAALEGLRVTTPERQK